MHFSNLLLSLALLIGPGLILDLKAQEEAPAPFSAPDTISKAQKFFEQNFYDTAATLYGKVPAGDTLYPLALLERTRSLYMGDRDSACIALAQQALAATREYRPAFLNLLASAYGDSDQPEEAYKTYNRAIKEYPSDHQLYYSRGVTYEEYEAYPKALADYKKALELNPFHYYSHIKIASLAVNEEAYAEALMALGYAMIVAEDQVDRLSLTVAYDRALSGAMELEPKNLAVEPNDVFQKINLLIKSQAALRDDYELGTDLTFPLVRQMHLTYSLLQKQPTHENSFWSQFYQPFYQELMADPDRFELFTLLLVLNSSEDFHQKLLRKNQNALSEFRNWARGKMLELNALHPKGYQPEAPLVRQYYFDQSNRISAIGEANEAGEIIGAYQSFHYSGALESVGQFNTQNEQAGRWVFFHESGDTARVLLFKNGQPNGVTREFHDNGALFIKSTFVDGVLSGPTQVYNRDGVLSRTLVLRNGQMEDTTRYYEADGSLSSVLPMRAGKVEGSATFYHKNGTKASEISFQNDQREGAATFYHPNGVVKARAAYRQGELHGRYQSFFANEQQESKGRYQDGIKVGVWKIYNPTGQLVTEETFDTKGKKTGESQEYDALGRKTGRFVYQKGDLAAYTFYDKAGDVLKEGKGSSRPFPMEFYNIHGTVIASGNFVDNRKLGPWEYRNGYGTLQSRENYNDEEQLEGLDTEYFGTDEIESEYRYAGGQLQGYFCNYYRNGALKNEGWYHDNELAGSQRDYHANGRLQTDSYYVKGRLNGPQRHYDPEGNLLREEYFSKGVLSRTSQYFEDDVYRASLVPAVGNYELYYPNGQLWSSIEKSGSLYTGRARWHYGHGPLKEEGEYRNGQQEGEWRAYFPNEQLSYQGQYRLGEPFGKWVFYHSNGERREERSYLNGEIHGPNPSYYDNGRIATFDRYYLGSYHGPRHFYLQDGSLNHVRVYDLGRIVGYYKQAGPGADTTLVTLKNGTGAVKSYYANGQLARQYQLDHGDFYGDYLAYYPDGTLALKSSYRSDERDGRYELYYPNGRLKKQSHYAMGIKEGLETTYYATGKKKAEVPYVAGIKHGTAVYYTEDGSVKHRYQYVNDEIYRKF